MVGGGLRKDDVLPIITSNNIFSALGSRRRKSSKKKLEKDSSLKELQTTTAVAASHSWTPPPIEVKSWADCAEEDDEEFYAMPVLPLITGLRAEADAVASHDQESSRGEESEENAEVEEPDEDTEEEPDAKAIHVKALPAPAPVLHIPDRQLSKKELKKKELAELDAVLAELGLVPKDVKGSIEFDIEQTATNGEVVVHLEASAAEIKALKRRRPKKQRSFREGRDEEGSQDAKEDGEARSMESTADPKDVIKKLASMKKKKSFKENDLAAKVAVAEASARAAKLAAAKKKEKNHYNQQPVR